MNPNPHGESKRSTRDSDRQLCVVQKSASASGAQPAAFPIDACGRATYDVCCSLNSPFSCKWFGLKRRKANDQAWSVAAKDVLEYDDDRKLVACNLNQRNPSSAEALEHLPPEQLVADILEKEHRTIEIIEDIKAELVGGGR